jgi:hypothetical protein
LEFLGEEKSGVGEIFPICLSLSVFSTTLTHYFGQVTKRWNTVKTRIMVVSNRSKTGAERVVEDPLVR